MLSGGGPWGLGFIGALVFFAVFEWRGLKHPERQWTLSKTLAYIGQNVPISIYAWGIFSGWLSFHLWGKVCM